MLEVISLAGFDNQKGAMWLCKCDCGNDFVTRARSLSTGDAMSCGCKRQISCKKHGMLNTRTYKTWRAVLDRCTNPNTTQFHRYGGRGITVCERWKDFRFFFEDMGERPSGMSLDRIDNDKGYFKENCRWSTPKEQSRNRGDNRILDTKLGKFCLVEAAEKYGIKYKTLHMRLNRGWSLEDALNKPVRSVRK